jgi:hypothetical protein
MLGADFMRLVDVCAVATDPASSQIASVDQMVLRVALQPNEISQMFCERRLIRGYARMAIASRD